MKMKTKEFQLTCSEKKVIENMPKHKAGKREKRENSRCDEDDHGLLKTKLCVSDCDRKNESKELVIR